MKEKIAFIGGTSLLGSDVFGDFKKIFARNKHGRVVLRQKENIYFIQRHEGGVPPHKINYRAYIQALADNDVKRIISVNSVGSLKKSVKTGKLLLPDDFISLWNIPTFYDKLIRHIRPEISAELRDLLAKKCRALKIDFYGQGVYFQTGGPRLETPAEIKMLADFGDVVGMTLGSEITLANERGIKIAAVCAIDNYGNGFKGEINYQAIRTGTRGNREKIELLVKSILQ